MRAGALPILSIHTPQAQEYPAMNDLAMNHQTALLYLLVFVSVADSDMTDGEITTLETVIDTAPVFRGYDSAQLGAVDEACAEILSEEDGVQSVLDLVRSALPDDLRETAYALACQVAASDGALSQEELRLLEMVRHELDIDRLTASAIERGVAALNRKGPA